MCLLFGDPLGVPGKEVGETAGAPTARRCIFLLQPSETEGIVQYVLKCNCCDASVQG